MKVVLIAAAMRAEVAPIARRLRDARKTKIDGVAVVRGQLGEQRVLIVRTGEGAGPAEQTMRSVLVREVVGGREDSVDFVIATGVAGALSGGFEPADLAIAHRVIDLASAELAPAPDALATGRLVGHTDGAVRPASFVSSRAILGTAAAKAATLADLGGEDEGAACVDLETAAVARAAADFGVPYVAIRAISDVAEKDMPVDFSVFQREDGSVRRGGVALHATFRPWKVPALLRLQRQVARGMARVANLLEDSLTRIVAV